MKNNKLTENHVSPIIYKIIPTQYAYLVLKDGTLKIKQLTTQEDIKKFKNAKEAFDYVDKLNYIL